MSTNDQLNSKTNDLANKQIKDGDLAKSEAAPLIPFQQLYNSYHCHFSSIWACLFLIESLEGIDERGCIERMQNLNVDSSHIAQVDKHPSISFNTGSSLFHIERTKTVNPSA